MKCLYCGHSLDLSQSYHDIDCDNCDVVNEISVSGQRIYPPGTSFLVVDYDIKQDKTTVTTTYMYLNNTVKSINTFVCYKKFAKLKNFE